MKKYQLDLEKIVQNKNYNYDDYMKIAKYLEKFEKFYDLDLSILYVRNNYSHAPFEASCIDNSNLQELFKISNIKIFDKKLEYKSDEIIQEELNRLIKTRIHIAKEKNLRFVQAPKIITGTILLKQNNKLYELATSSWISFSEENSKEYNKGYLFNTLKRIKTNNKEEKKKVEDMVIKKYVWLYDIYLDKLEQGNLVGDNGEMSFKTKEEALKDANAFIEDLAKEYNSDPSEFRIVFYKVEEE